MSKGNIHWTQVPIDPATRNLLCKAANDNEEIEKEIIKFVSKRILKGYSSTQQKTISAQTQNADFAKIRRWKYMKSTPQELERFQDSLWKSEKIKEGEWTRGEIGELGQLLGEELPPSKNHPLPNGETLYGAERNALRIYTEEHYLLINGTLCDNKVNLDLWLEKRLERMENSEHINKNDFLKRAQSYVDTIAKVLASGINKLPSYKGLLYRGDTLTPEDIKEWRQGKIFITNKFFSCSANMETGEMFAMSKTMKYIQNKQREYKPVLYAFACQQAKDISSYSRNAAEEEVIYTPGQVFRAVEVNEEAVPGMAIVFLKELN